MSTHTISPGQNVIVPTRPAWLLRQRLAGTISEWRRRIVSRRELAALTALDVKDIGYPAGLEAEKCKPFWES
jgi:uncharacterized protein YjiS (DUF1127 family)